MARRSIYQRVHLSPGQAREVAERRLVDAEYLALSGLPRHANGAIYLAGLAVECMLKAALIDKQPHLGAGDVQQVPKGEAYRWELIHRRHQLDSLLTELPEIRARVQRAEAAGRKRLAATLKRICGTWTIFARYSPTSASSSDARVFVQEVRELKPWLVNP
ncbi:MAG: hypothetical protein WEC33_05335 [Dehalococcoidia bacterium]